jgi:hypothetical protein
MVANSRSSSLVSMAHNLFDSAYLLLSRAREHREELHRRGQTFIDEHPYTDITEREPHTGYYIRKLRFSEQPPGFLFPIAADAFNNLRHALDQAICASALAKNSIIDLTGISFPLCETPAKFNENMRKTRPKLAPKIVATVEMFQPYNGGDRRLWALGNMSNVNKHRGLIGLGAHPQPTSVSVNPFTLFNPNFVQMHPIWDSDKNELTVSATPTPDELSYDLSFEVYIALGNTEVFGGQDVFSVLDYLTVVIEAILTGIESDTIRLFPNSF